MSQGTLLEPAPRLGRWSAALFVALVAAAAYVLVDPHTADLAAQTARAELFRRSGFVPLWTGWYSGIATASYSLTTPPLLGLLGPLWLGAASILATAAIAVPLLRDALRPRAGAVVVVLVSALNVFSGRTTFAVGVVVALAAMLAVERRASAAAAGLAAVTTATSPVAGVLLLVVLAAVVISDPTRRRLALLAVGSVGVVLLGLEILSHGDGSGYQPFTRTSLLMAVGTALIAVVAPVAGRVRAAAALTILALVAVYFVHSPIGSNASRIAVLATPAAIVATVRLSRTALVGALAGLASLLAVAQAHNDLSAVSSAYTSRGDVAPLAARLAGEPSLAGHRVELVDAATHWPSTYLLPTVALARGWERQTDEGRNPEFYGRAPLTAASYRAFLDRNAVAFVAEPRGVTIDYGATREKALIDHGLPYLRKVWGNPRWTLWAVADPTGIVSAPAVVVSALDTGVAVRVPSAGTYPIRLRWSPYLVTNDGTVRRDPDGMTTLVARSAGVLRVHGVWRVP